MMSLFHVFELSTYPRLFTVHRHLSITVHAQDRREFKGTHSSERVYSPSDID